MHQRTLRTVVSRVRKELDQQEWDPREKPGFAVTIRSDKGPETVLSFLKKLYQNAMCSLVFDVPNMPTHRDYVFRVW